MLNDLDIIFPGRCILAAYPPGATYGPRVMRDFEFVGLVEGDAEYHWGETIVPAPEGSIVLCRPGATDFFRWDPKRRTRHAFFHFDIRQFPSNWPPMEQWPLVRLPAQEDILRPLFRHLLTWSMKGDKSLQLLTVMHMVTAFVRGETATADLPRDPLPDATERAWAYLCRRLEEDPSAPITLDEMADAAYVTREHLCRLFKASTGHSPAEAVRLARLDRAAVLLARSNYSIGEIAHLCGFSSPFHFSRRFKEAFGASPRELRNRFQSGFALPLPRLLRFSQNQI